MFDRDGDGNPGPVDDQRWSLDRRQGGADVEAKAANGKTARQVATGEEVMRVLREASGKR